jgi:hypothetical protein
LRRLGIVEKREPTIHDAFIALRNLALGDKGDQRTLGSLKGKTDEEIGQVLRTRDPKLYSHAAIGELLGVSKATAYRLSKSVDG